MSESPLRDELLKQNGYGDSELARLRDAVAIENARVRRIGRWAAVVWLTWVAMIALSLVLPMVAYQLARGSGPTTQPSTQPATMVAANSASGGGVMSVVGPVIGALLVSAFFILPVVGIILLVRLLLARRGVHLSHIMLSLAAIEGQLRVLMAERRGQIK